MAFEPQNTLEQSLIQASTDPAHRPQFYRDLAESDFFVIQDNENPEGGGHREIKPEESLRIRSIEWNGQQYLPVFSSLPRLQAMLQSEALFVQINALELLKLTRGADVILNPGAEYGKLFPKEEIAAIIDGTIWQPTEHSTEKETEIMIGQPANYPQELVDTLARYFKTRPEVTRAYLAHFYNPERDTKAHTLIGVEVIGNWDDVAAGAVIVSQGVTVPDPPVDFLQIMGNGGVEEYFTRSCQPFYQKQIMETSYKL